MLRCVRVEFSEEGIGAVELILHDQRFEAIAGLLSGHTGSFKCLDGLSNLLVTLIRVERAEA